MSTHILFYLIFGREYGNQYWWLWMKGILSFRNFFVLQALDEFRLQKVKGQALCSYVRMLECLWTSVTLLGLKSDFASGLKTKLFNFFIASQQKNLFTTICTIWAAGKIMHLIFSRKCEGRSSQFLGVQILKEKGTNHIHGKDYKDCLHKDMRYSLSRNG